MTIAERNSAPNVNWKLFERLMQHKLRPADARAYLRYLFKINMIPTKRDFDRIEARITGWEKRAEKEGR